MNSIRTGTVPVQYYYSIGVLVSFCFPSLTAELRLKYIKTAGKSSVALLAEN